MVEVFTQLNPKKKQTEVNFKKFQKQIKNVLDDWRRYEKDLREAQELLDQPDELKEKQAWWDFK